MDIPPVSHNPPSPVMRQTVSVHTENGPRKIEVVLAGVMATVTQMAKPQTTSPLVDKKV